MGDSWLSTIYFPKMQQMPMDLIVDLLDRLAKRDLVYPHTEDAAPIWFSPIHSWYANDTDEEEVPTHITDLPAQEALRLTEKYQGGTMNLYDYSTSTFADLGMYLCGNPTADEKTAEHHYGSISLDVDYTHLHHDAEDLIRQRYLQIFRWCNVIARTGGAIYGWGDLGWHILNPSYTVAKSALDAWQIPRIAWWNYFSDEYVRRVGGNFLGSAGPWMTDDSHGMTIILRPPGEPAFLSQIEAKEMFSD